MSAEKDDLARIREAAAGSRVALECLLVSYYDRLAQHVGRQLPTSFQGVVDVDDILQQTYMQVFRDIRTFQPRSVGSFVAWLKKIADHRILDTVKALKRKKRGGGLQHIQHAIDSRRSSVVDLVEQLSAGSHRPSRSLARREAACAVQVGVAGLSDEQREAVRLRIFEGKSLAETAAAMRRTPGAVRGLIYRAKQELRDALGRSSRWLSKR